MTTKIIKESIDKHKSTEHVKTSSKKHIPEILYKVDTSHLEEISNLIEIKNILVRR